MYMKRQVMEWVCELNLILEDTTSLIEEALALMTFECEEDDSNFSAN